MKKLTSITLEIIQELQVQPKHFLDLIRGRNDFLALERFKILFQWKRLNETLKNRKFNYFLEKIYQASYFNKSKVYSKSIINYY